MVKKSLPKVKKSLKSFILEEDAKVMDKSMVKIAAVASFAGAMILDSMGNAYGYDEYCHHNELNVDSSNAGNIHNGINPTDNGIQGLTKNTITTVHGNHFNHGNHSSWWPGGDDCDEINGEKITINLSRYEMNTQELNELNHENLYNSESDGQLRNDPQSEPQENLREEEEELPIR